MPKGVATEVAYGDLVREPDAVLFPEEADAVAAAMPGRRREFATGRLCARGAMERLGHAAVPIVRDRRGAPRWPPGLVGSLTHCTGYRAAAVADSREVRGLGIDAELHMPLPDGILTAVSLPQELAHLRILGRRHPEVCWDRLLFSAKESVFKVWHPLTGRELGFREAELRLDALARTWSARLLVPGPDINGERLASLSGRWLVRYGLIVTSCVLRRTP